MRFEILTAVTMAVTVSFFWVLTLCRFVGMYKSFGEIFYPSSGLKIATLFFPELLVSTYQPTRCHSPEQHCKYLNCQGTCEISSSHSGEYEAQNLLGCTAVLLIGCRPTFQWCVLPPSSGRSSPHNEGSTHL
jgi:hypothetical protein